jgi:F0F1-type ATP synthase assembly protein I
VPEQHDDRSPLAHTMQWTADVTAIAFQMVVPILVGAWIDHRLGTKAVFAVVGGAIGMASGLRSLLRMTEPLRRGGKMPGNRHDDHPQPPP